jgi:energy-coupling factor transporter ATP-binding protein EcfA2
MQTQNQRITIEEISSKLKPILGSKIDDLYFKYTISEDLDEKNEILQVLGMLYQKHLGNFLEKNILLEPPEKSAVSGKYPLSKVVYAGKELYDFALNECDWPRHVCISGMSGSGKTTLALNILENFIKHDKPFLVFDWKKSFRPLMNLDGSVMCFTVGNDAVSNFFKTNINVPPKNVSPKEWINVLCDLLTESFQVSFGVHKILLETLDEVFEGWGVYKGSKHYPNWQHIKKMLELKSKEARGREATWYESAMRIASVLTFGDFGKVINYDGKKSLSVEDLFDKKIIFELNSLGNIEKKFFSEFILTYIYKLKKANQNKIDEKFNYAILVDEAHNIFLKNKTYFVSESITDMVYREMREYGISLICLDQHISKLSDTVKGNSACHIAFQQQLPQDVMDVSSLMHLQNKKEIFSQLPVGSAIVKLSERYNQPFLIKVPFSELRTSEIAEDKISKRMGFVVQTAEVEKTDPEFMEQITHPEKIKIEIKDEKIDNVNSVEIFKISLTETQKVLSKFVSEQLSKKESLGNVKSVLESGLHNGLYTKDDIEIAINESTKPKVEKKEIPKKVQNLENKMSPEILSLMSSLEEEEKQFMNYLLENQKHKFSTVEFYKNAGFSTRKGNIIKNNLLNKNLIKIQEQKYENGWKKFIRLTDKYSNSLK